MKWLAVKRFLFPKRLKTPPTPEELRERRRSFARSFASTHAAGNVALARGHFRLQK